METQNESTSSPDAGQYVLWLAMRLLEVHAAELGVPALYRKGAHHYATTALDCTRLAYKERFGEIAPSSAPLHDVVDWAEALIKKRLEMPSPIPRRLQKLEAYCREFIHEKQITCGDSIYQVDSIHQALPEFVEQICELLGYAPSEE